MKLNFVEGNSWTGFEMSRKMAFVHELEYNAKVGSVLGSPECTAERIMMPGYNRNAASVPGTLLEFDELPPNVKYEKIRVFSGTDRRLRSEYLNPQNTFRTGQPQDRFRYAVDKFKIPFSGAPGTGKSFKALKDEAEKVQAELELKNEAEVRNAGAALRGVISHPASMLAGEDEDAAIEGVGIGGARRGTGGGRGRGGGGQGGRASPATPRPVSVASVAATFAAPGTPGALSVKNRASLDMMMPRVWCRRWSTVLPSHQLQGCQIRTRLVILFLLQVAVVGLRWVLRLVLPLRLVWTCRSDRLIL